MFLRYIKTTFLIIVLLLLAACTNSNPPLSSKPTPNKGTQTANANSIIYGFDNADNFINSYQVNAGKLQLKRSSSLGDFAHDTNAADDKYITFSNGIFYTAISTSVTAIRVSDSKVLWDEPLSADPVTSPLRDHNSLYVITPGGRSLLIEAFNIQNGSLEWRQDFVLNVPNSLGMDEPDDVIGGTQISNNILYMGTNYGAAAFDLSKHTLLWYHHEDAAYGFGELVLQPDALYIFTPQGKLGFFALNPQTGKILWSYETLNPNQNNIIDGDPFSYSITPTSIYVYNNETVQAINRLTGIAIWKIQYRSLTNNEDIGPLAFDDNTLYFPTGPGGGDILALNRKDGSKLWYNQSTDAYQTLAAGQGQVYALGQKTLYAFDAKTGTSRWKRTVNADNSRVITTQNAMYVTDAVAGLFHTTSNVESIDPITGKTLWKATDTQIILTSLP